MQEAYDVLSDPKKRQMYDQFGFYSENGFPGAGAGGPGGASPHPDMDFSGFDFSDVLHQSRSGAGRAAAEPRPAAVSAISSRNSSAAAAQSEPASPKRARDLEYVLDIDFWQAIRGTQARSTSPVTKSAPPATARAPAARAKSPARSATAPAM